jgi:DNA replication protein DnaC
VPARPAPARPEGDLHRLLAHRLQALKLPGFARDYERVAQQCAAEGLDNAGFLLCLTELELAERRRQLVERRIREAQFPAVKRLDGFDFAALPRLDEGLVRQLARCDYLARHENLIATGGSGTGKTHLAIGLGLAACRKGLSVGYTTAAALVTDLIEARGERHLSRLQRRLAHHNLLIVDELGDLPLPSGGAELLFEVFGRRCERGSTIVVSNRPPGEWAGIFGCERLTGALLDRLTHRAHLLDMTGDSYRSR